MGAEIVKALFWFHPVAWLACARLRWFEELACDQSAAGDDPLRYARALLAVARLHSHRLPSLALSGGSQLARRVDVLVDAPRLAPWWAGAALAVALALLPFLPFVRFALVGAPASMSPNDHSAVHALRHGH
jgi:beta-lactamase regulating signal transducer with metallopeptidase domain